MNGITSISAVTLWVREMNRSIAFYEALGFGVTYGGLDQPFTSLKAGMSHLNLRLIGRGVEEGVHSGADSGEWGRIIFHVADVDATYQTALDAGMTPEAPPADAVWGERYFHLTDPDGHDLSFAKPLNA